MSSVASQKATQAAQSVTQGYVKPAKAPTAPKLRSILKEYEGQNRTWAKSAPAILNRPANVTATVDLTIGGSSMRTTAHLLNNNRVVFSRAGGFINQAPVYMGPMSLDPAAAVSKK